ncbi:MULTISPECIES: molybdopterin cofactor-binding domain-containing protein [unclassified Pseudovibrio]|uniref:xanthine dehydrogenase family protein molybdopterin-binding subunit n=1 Tax=unclassified Pseudovibrio TaxID=2627060 RepID=UPI0007AED66D|nr:MULTISPECIES: molybdopterin cofactor-binding domain-containing protein [unclassified Pseudovibrio]KZK97347.1 Nicotinate dehydrogenase subunit B [Pseudovibrio sp. W74]KZL10296.1 Nicotinate dehydrogenase subunit B [Pseudovibrio sp. Ad14]
MKPATQKKRRFTRRGFLKAAGWTAAGLTVTYFVGREFAPVMASMRAPDFEEGTAWIKVDLDGTVRMLSPVHEMGQGSSLGLAQIVAEELNVDVEDIQVSLPSTNDVTRLQVTVGSSGTSNNARPLAEAAAGLREELRQRAAKQVGLDAHALGDAKGGFTTPEGQVVTFADIVTGTNEVIDLGDLPDATSYTFDPGREKVQVGKTALQVQGRDIVTGKEVYALDVRLPNMTYGRGVPAPVAGAQIVDVDDGGVSSMPGVIKVVVDKERNFAGIVAETPSVLDAALEQMTVQWDSPSSYTQKDIDAMIDVDIALLAGELDSILENDDVAQDQVWTVDRRQDLPIVEHATIERRSAVIQFSERDGREVVEIWAGTQDMFVNQKKAAAELGWSTDRVTVHLMRVGGGFGGRATYDVVRDAVLLGREVDRPVKVVWSLRDEFLADRTRPPSSHRVRIKADDDGKITEWWHAFVSGHVMFNDFLLPEGGLSLVRKLFHDIGATIGSHPFYTVDRRRIEFTDVELPFHVGQWRSLGATPNSLAAEAAVEELARTLNLDPISLRMQNLGPEQDRLKTCLTKLKTICAARPLPEDAEVGRGYAAAIFAEQTHVAMAFDVSYEKENEQIRIDRCYCVLDPGFVFSPDQVKAQIEGGTMMAIGQVLVEGAPIDDGSISAYGFFDYPIATIDHAPEFEIELISDPSVAPSGVGEAALIAALPALVNAIRAATGYRASKLPIDEDDLVATINTKG